MLFGDLRHAVRSIRLRPGSSAAAILTLALAIAANATLFTLINAVLLGACCAIAPMSVLRQ